MEQSQVGIRELKARLGRYLDEVRAGRSFVITDRGKPIGRIIPIQSDFEAHVRDLVAAGLLDWDLQKLEDRAPVARTLRSKSISDLIVENRE